MFKNLERVAGVLFPVTLFFEINVTIIQYLMLALILQNLCVTATHQPIKEILEKEKKVCLFFMLVLCLVSMGLSLLLMVSYSWVACINLSIKSTCYLHVVKIVP